MKAVLDNPRWLERRYSRGPLKHSVAGPAISKPSVDIVVTGQLP